MESEMLYMIQKFQQPHRRDSTSYTLDEPHTIPLARIEKIELAD